MAGLPKKNTSIKDLSEKFEILFDVVTDIKVNQAKAVIIPIKPKSLIREHIDAFVENALKSPHSTLSGLAVGATYLGAKVFPQYAQVLNETQIFFTGLTGITAGSALIKPSANVSAKPLPSSTLTNTESEKMYG